MALAGSIVKRRLVRLLRRRERSMRRQRLAEQHVPDHQLLVEADELSETPGSDLSICFSLEVRHAEVQEIERLLRVVADRLAEVDDGANPDAGP